MPVFYRDVMYREGAEGKDEAYLKLYDGHDWILSAFLFLPDNSFLRFCCFIFSITHVYILAHIVPEVNIRSFFW